ncbi:MAG: hypothetical protein OHK0046_50210 [Anaerolineae bacterium]
MQAQERIAAIIKLGELQAVEAIPNLVAVLHDSDAGIRWAAVFALGQMPSPPLAALQHALQDGDKWVRAAAARALGLAGDRQAVPALTAALHDPESLVRVAVADALGLIGDPASAPALTSRLEDTDSAALSRGERVADVARQALARLRPVQAVSPPVSLPVTPPVLPPAPMPTRSTEDDMPAWLKETLEDEPASAVTAHTAAHAAAHEPPQADLPLELPFDDLALLPPPEEAAPSVIWQEDAPFEPPVEELPPDELWMVVDMEAGEPEPVSTPLLNTLAWLESLAEAQDAPQIDLSGLDQAALQAAQSQTSRVAEAQTNDLLEALEAFEEPEVFSGLRDIDAVDDPPADDALTLEFEDEDDSSEGEDELYTESALRGTLEAFEEAEVFTGLHTLVEAEDADDEDLPDDDAALEPESEDEAEPEDEDLADEDDPEDLDDEADIEDEDLADEDDPEDFDDEADVEDEDLEPEDGLSDDDDDIYYEDSPFDDVTYESDAIVLELDDIDLDEAYEEDEADEDDAAAADLDDESEDEDETVASMPDTFVDPMQWLAELTPDFNGDDLVDDLSTDTLFAADDASDDEDEP